MMALSQAEFSLLDFKASEEATKLHVILICRLRCYTPHNDVCIADRMAHLRADFSLLDSRPLRRP